MLDRLTLTIIAAIMTVGLYGNEQESISQVTEFISFQDDMCTTIKRSFSIRFEKEEKKQEIYLYVL
jgi:hypothetical protein